jgi:hypothetical protein
MIKKEIQNEEKNKLERSEEELRTFNRASQISLRVCAFLCGPLKRLHKLSGSEQCAIGPALGVRQRRDTQTKMKERKEKN